MDGCCMGLACGPVLQAGGGLSIATAACEWGLITPQRSFVSIDRLGNLNRLLAKKMDRSYATKWRSMRPRRPLGCL